MKSIGQIAGTQLPRHVTARLAGLGAAPGALVWQPAPPVTGDPAIARRLLNGVLLFEGRLVEMSDPHPWDIPAPDHVWEAALHGHAWLDDAAASKDPAHWRGLAHWMWIWLERYGDGSGPGWAPDVAARRLTRWTAHSVRLLSGQGADRSAAFFAALGMQARYVDWRWRELRQGVARIEALSGLVYARLSLEGSGSATTRAIGELGAESARIVQPSGGIASRSPAELARVLALLTWSFRSIEDAGLEPAPAHADAIRRAEAVVQALRHPSGTLAQFHGGRSGIDLLPEDLARLRDKGASAHLTNPMGYHRLTKGLSFLILDGAPGPGGPDTLTAHASALAFEFSHGAQQMVVNCGPGQGFGNQAAHSARRMAAHSGVEIGDRCAGHLAEVRGDPAAAHLTTRGTVSARMLTDKQGDWLLAESTLYESWFGLRVERRLNLSPDGLRLRGEDTALATRAETRAHIARAFPAGGPACQMAVRLHFHPDLRLSWALNRQAVEIRLPDGPVWMFSSDAERLELRPSQFFDEQRPKPRATQQIVAISHVLEYWGRVNWTLARLPDGSSPLQSRDQNMR